MAWRRMQRDDEFWGAQAASLQSSAASPTTHFFKAKVVSMCVQRFGKLPKRTGWQPVLPSDRELYVRCKRSAPINRRR